MKQNFNSQNNKNDRFDQALINVLATEQKRVWLKKQEGGFNDGTQVLKHVEGVVTEFKAYGIKFINGQASKTDLESDGKAPEGYKKTIDLTIQADHTTYGLSIENKTGISNLARYAGDLDQRGLKIGATTTRFIVQNNRGTSGPYTAVDFEIAQADSSEPVDMDEVHEDF